MLKDIEQIFCSVVRVLPCHDTRLLHVVQLGEPPHFTKRDGAATKPRVDFWFTGLRRLTKIRTLIIESEPNETFLWLEWPGNRLRPPFPELKMLKFRHCSMDAPIFRDAAQTRRNPRSLSINRDTPHLSVNASVADAILAHLATRSMTYKSILSLHFTSFYDSGYEMQGLFEGSAGVGTVEEVENESDMEDEKEDDEPLNWFD